MINLSDVSDSTKIVLSIAKKIGKLGLKQEPGMSLANGLLEAVEKARSRMSDGDFETFCAFVLGALEE